MERHTELEELSKTQKHTKCHAEPCPEFISGLFQHLIKSKAYETLNQVQGDKMHFGNKPFRPRALGLQPSTFQGRPVGFVGAELHVRSQNVT